MSIASEISRLQQAKTDIKTAIEAKGVTVLSSLKLDGYASCISQISGGGGGSIVLEDGIKFGSSTFSVLPQWLKDADWSNLVDMASCFSNCTLLREIDLTLSNVSKMSGCFSNCYFLSQVAISGLSNVSTMAGCFQVCSSLTSITLSGLSNVSTMAGCFSGCKNLISVTLSGLSNVSTMAGCFSGCTSLSYLVVDSWGTVITYLGSWGISNCTRLTHESLLNLISALYTTATSRTCTIGTTNLAKLTAEEIAVATAKGWNLN